MIRPRPAAGRSVLLLSPLPALGLSVWYFLRYRLASSPLSTFVATSACAILLAAIVDPAGGSAADFTKWWFTLFSLAWLVAAAALKVKRRASIGLLTWAVNVGALAFFWAMHAQTEVPFKDDWRRCRLEAPARPRMEAERPPAAHTPGRQARLQGPGPP